MRPHQFGPAVLDGAASGLRIEQGHLRLTLMARISVGFVPQGQLRSTIARGRITMEIWDIRILALSNLDRAPLIEALIGIDRQMQSRARSGGGKNSAARSGSERMRP